MKISNSCNIILIILSISLKTDGIKNCTIEQFSCRSSLECIALNWMCDGNNDCTDGSDEIDCHELCRGDEFTCNNKRCIQKQWLCDFDDDCGDKSDELDCNSKRCIPKDNVLCHEKNCLTSSRQCHENLNCSNIFINKECDEFNETIKFGMCPENEVVCDNYMTCIHPSWFCDGDEDCSDGLDELPVNCKSTSCKGEDFFDCYYRTCNFDNFIERCSKSLNCSNINLQNSCFDTFISCGSSELNCIERICKSIEDRCNKTFDCIKQRKNIESLCKRNECHTANGGCPQVCVNLSIGHRCDCYPGYFLKDNETCEDINECLEQGSCSQICNNKKGGFICDCVDGYAKDPKNINRCKAIEGHASLLFTKQHGIRKIGLDRKEMTALVNNTMMATAFDFVFRTGMIFWNDLGEKKINKAPIDEGNDKQPLINGDIIISDGLALDWIYNHIYWIDTKKSTLAVANLDGTMKKTLFKDSFQELKSIVLNPIDGWMFWTDCGKNARIEKAGMDGSYRMDVIVTDIKWPNGITLDLIGKKIFWMDAKLNSISSCNYDGSSRKTILHSSIYLKHPFSITLFEDFMYWTEWSKRAIFRANKFNGSELEAMVTSTLEKPIVVKIYHPYKQPDSINHCQVINGRCSHLCLPKPKINLTSLPFSCACPNGWILLEDNSICSEKENNKSFLLEATKTDFSKIRFKIIIITIAIFVGLPLIFLIIRKNQEKFSYFKSTSMNFQNPAYKRLA